MNTPESFDEMEREFRFNASAQAAKEAPTSEGGRYNNRLYNAESGRAEASIGPSAALGIKSRPYNTEDGTS